MLKNAVIPFTLGSSALNNYPLLGPNSGEAQHHFDMDVLKAVALATEKNQRRLAVQLSEQHSDLIYAIGEIGSQIQEQTDVISEGLEDVERAVEHMERVISAHLSGITFVLSQIDEKFTQLLHVVRFRRETETAELVKDGALALSKGYIDDAEKCFSEAERLKPVSYIVNLNLGFLSITKDDVDAARRYFQKAADYADSDGDARVFALENLARTYYVMGKFAEASRVTEEVLTKTALSDNTYQSRFFYSAFYLALSGKSQDAVKKFSDLCLQNPDFISQVALNQELVDLQRPFLEQIDRLAVEKRQIVEKLIAEFDSYYKTHLSPVFPSAHPDAKAAIGEAVWFARSIEKGLEEKTLSNMLFLEFRALKLNRIGEDCLELVRVLERLEVEKKETQSAERNWRTKKLRQDEGLFEFLPKLWILLTLLFLAIFFFDKGLGQLFFGTGNIWHRPVSFKATGAALVVTIATIFYIGWWNETRRYENIFNRWLRVATEKAHDKLAAASNAESESQKKVKELLLAIQGACCVPDRRDSTQRRQAAEKPVLASRGMKRHD